jgi:hypothetical protein
MNYDTVASNTGHVANVCHLTLQCRLQYNVEAHNSAHVGGPGAPYRGV